MSIFISIASYRDDQCSHTLDSIYHNARNPQDVYVGICQQNHPEDPDCVAQAPKQYERNIRIIRIPSYEAQGPTKARYLCSTLYNGEDFYLQIDSHTRFGKDWDDKLKGMIQTIVSKGYTNKPVISSYPPSSKQFHEYNSLTGSTSVPRICETQFNDRGMLTLTSSKHISTDKKFYRTPFVAAGYFFCPGSFLKEMPFDPNLPNLFQGEEILLSARFYTNGWDIFTPNENVLFHEYTREDKPKFWDNRASLKDEDAYAKVKQYLRLNSIHENVPSYLQLNMEHYGLGKQRTIEQFYDFAGVDVNGKKVSKNFCDMDLVEGYEPIETGSQTVTLLFIFVWLLIPFMVLSFLLYKLADLFGPRVHHVFVLLAYAILIYPFFILIKLLLL